MNFTTDVVIGLEIHIGINTKSKLFSSAPNTDGEPNTVTTPVCLGHPGAKPVVNIESIKKALKLCTATKCDIADEVIFSRKSYFYPDLGKNFQTTQYELPIGSNGSIELPSGKKINLERIHIEEDPASLVHTGGVSNASYSAIDYNRSGTPLLELVTKPDMTSPEEAREFLRTLIGILGTLGIFDVKNGLIKADANVSIKESNYTRAEIKNISGFKEIEKALTIEIERQKQAVANGEELFVETRGWDAENEQTYLMRKKETEADYGYIIDPDLVPIEVTKELLNSVGEFEIPVEFAKRIAKEHSVKFEDVYIIANQKAFGEIYKEALKINPTKATNWFRHVLPTPYVAKYADIEHVENVYADEVLELFNLFIEGKVSDKVMKDILEKLVESKFSPSEYIKEQGLEMVSDSEELETYCAEAIAENPDAVKDFKAGIGKALNSLVGQVMKKSKGKANPGEVAKIIKEKLE